MMQIFIMRHGEAALEAASDAGRELTHIGRAQSRAMAGWLAAQKARFDQVLVSPYIRAQQTLDVVREVLSLPDKAQVEQALTPGGDAHIVRDYLHRLAQQGNAGVLVISHLPLVGYLVAALCPQQTAPMFTTSAISHITFDAGQGQGVYHGQMNPVQLPLAKGVV